jgi:hypothetical protein
MGWDADGVKWGWSVTQPVERVVALEAEGSAGLFRLALDELSGRQPMLKKTSRDHRRERLINQAPDERYATSRRNVRMTPAVSGTANHNTIEKRICGTWPAHLLSSTQFQIVSVSIQSPTSVDTSPSSATAGLSTK